MKNTLFISLALISIIIETKLSIFGIHPNLSVLVVYYFALRHNETKSMFFGALTGALSDGISGQILGPGLLAKGIVGFLSPHIRMGFFTWTPALGFLTAFTMTLIDGAVSLSSLMVFSGISPALPDAALALLLQALFNGSAGAFIKIDNED